MWVKQYLVLPEALQKAGISTFEQVMNLQGKVFRSVVGRKTIQVNLGDKSYFIKQHFGVGWGEIVKSFLSGKKPILGAMTEVRAIQKLGEIGIPTTPLVAYGQQGYSPASMRSFVITEDLGDIVSLEDVCADWQENPPEAKFKQNLIIAMAQLAAKLHDAGLSHRDFYLCHFALKKSELAQGIIKYYLLDLHRMLQGQQPNSGAVMKDVAGLIFSAMDCGFTAEDWALFKQYYLPQSDDFWIQVEARSKALYSKFHSDKFQKRLSFENSALD
jgi:heptose I phosphotransferase